MTINKPKTKSAGSMRSPVLCRIITLLIILTFVCTFSAVPAAAEEKYDDDSYVDPGFDFPESDVDHQVFQEKYDLRNVDGKSYVSSPKNQGDWGTCWTFATMTSLESNLAKQGYSNLDLSERHLAYFTYNHQDIASLQNPYPGLEGIKGDFITLYVEDWMECGGNNIIASMTLASGLGIVNEADAPYSPYESMEKLQADRAINLNKFQVQNISWVGKENKETIQKYLMEKGAGAVSIYADTSNPTYCQKMSDGTYSYYVHDSKTANHAVTLIGWDDGYSSENFADGYQPEGPGAWLIQNSWGNDYTYLWVSYYDTAIDNFGFFEAGDIEYDSIYQYDGTAQTTMSSYNVNSLGIANVYTANSAETLNAVSFFINNADVSYTVKIYTGVSDDGGPESGELKATQTGSRTDAGYVYVPLNTEISLDAGESFSVVITINTDEAGVYCFEDRSYSNYNPESPNSPYTVTQAHVEPGQSYVNYDGSSWHDVYYDTDGATNLRIKAFTTNEVTPEPFYGGGSGTENDPYIISTAEHLNNVRYNLSAHYRLANDIDLSGYSFEPIGNAAYSYFSGSFDGDGYTISNLKIADSGADGLGLFGCINGGTVTDLKLSGISIIGNNNCGSLAGIIKGSSQIQNCVIEGAEISGKEKCGGFVGELYNVDETENFIQNCAVTSVVRGASYIGGFAGEVYGNQTITQSYTVSTVTGTGGFAGGFVGQAHADGIPDTPISISNSYAYAVVDAPYGTGGFAGGFANGVILNVYSTGYVNATQYAGGLVGVLGNTGYLIKSFALPQTVSGTADTNRIVGSGDTTFISNSYAFDRMLNLAGEFTETGAAGTSAVSTKLWNSSEIFSDTGFDFSTVWKLNTTNDDYLLPELIHAPLLLSDSRDASYLKPLTLTIEDLVIIPELPKSFENEAEAVVVTVKEGIVGNGTITVMYDEADDPYDALTTDVPATVGVYNVTAVIGEGDAYAAVNLTLGHITVVNNVMPDIDINVDEDEGGNITVTYNDAETTISITYGADGGEDTMIITDKGTGVEVRVIGSDCEVKEGKYNASGITSITAVYPINMSASPIEGGEVKYNLTINLGVNMTTLLPEITSVYNETIAKKIADEFADSRTTFTGITMITAEGENVDAVNGNLTSINLVFTIPKSIVEKAGGINNLVIYHVGDGEPKKISHDSPVESGDNYIINVTGYGFSSYVAGTQVTVEPTPTPEPDDPYYPPSPSSPTVTPTVTPTPTVPPTAEPTVPTDIPGTQPTAPGKSPAPAAGLILGGLAAAAVLRRR